MLDFKSFSRCFGIYLPKKVFAVQAPEYFEWFETKKEAFMFIKIQSHLKCLVWTKDNPNQMQNMFWESGKDVIFSKKKIIDSSFCGKNISQKDT